MRTFIRGSNVSFTHTFYDSSGDITSPSSAHLDLSYPSTGFPFRGVYDSTTVTLTQNSTTLAYEGSWSTTAASAAGTVYYHIHSDDVTHACEDGEFILRANRANIAAHND